MEEQERERMEIEVKEGQEKVTRASIEEAERIRRELEEEEERENRDRIMTEIVFEERVVEMVDCTSDDSEEQEEEIDLFR